MKTLRFASFMLAFAPALCAQEPDITFPPPDVAIVHPQRVPPGYVAPQLPQPPGALQNRESSHPRLPVPIGPANQLPQPNGPETQLVDVATQPELTGQFRFFQNELVNPSSTSRSPRTPEPATGVLRDTVFQTGNWHAAISPDNGQTWSNVSPYSFFPAADGGFCCDQQAADIASHGFVVWMLQYSQASGGQNRLRFAVANTRDKLRSGSSGDWYYYDIRPSLFGYTGTEWFDYEDIAWDGTWLYCRTNVIGQSESLIFRMGLTQMANAQSVSLPYYKSGTIGGWSHRLAKGCVGTMAFAALKSTTEAYVWTWPSSSGSSATRSTRAISAYTVATVSVPGPDGRDWAGFWNATGQMQGAYGNATECGFSWGCAPRSGRAMPYTRVARFRLSDRVLLGEHDIWNSTNAYLYNDMMSNAAGEVGGTIAVGSASSYVHVSNYIIDTYDPWPVSNTYSQAGGSSGPNTNRFGDYFTVRRHPLSPNTWFSNGSSCPDPNTGNHRYVWFGRDDNEPNWVSLTVNSTPISGVSITQDVEDLDGLASGTSTFTRRFAPQQGYELTAPASVVSGRTTYVFDHWRLRVQPGANFNTYPVGQRDLEVSNCGNLDDTAEAVYAIRRTLTVQSQNPSSGVSITVSPSDINGAGNGSTAFTRYYRDGEPVSLTAPSAIGPDPFRYWTVNGVPQSAGATTINLSMSGSNTAVAMYWDAFDGSWRSIGAGCRGSNGLVPLHTISQSGSRFLQGLPMTWSCQSAPPSSAGLIMFGLSDTFWNGFPLPMNLVIIGGNGCFLYHDLVVTENAGAGSSGRASFTLTLPVQAAYVGTKVFTSFVFLDARAPRPLPLTYSNAVELLQGGLR